MRVSKIVFSIASLLAGAGTAYGHGVQIQLTHNPTTGKIETREIVHTDARPTSISDVKRVYVLPLLTLTGGAGNGWYTRPDADLNIFGVPEHPTGPGLTYQYDEPAQLPGTGWAYSGSSTMPNLQGTNFAYRFADSFKGWDGSSFVDPGAEQLQAFRGDGTAVPTIFASTSDTGPFTSLAMSSITSKSTNAHHSIGFRLLGDGLQSGLTGPTAGDDGIYLASLTVTSTAIGAAESDIFYFVLHKNMDAASALAAANSLGFDPSLVQVVPEPSSLTLLLAAGGLLLSRKRRCA